MSASATPISASAFAQAIQDLPVGNLHAKAAELQNSISHLRHSNDQLKPLSEEGDVECTQAIRENEEVIARMRDRIRLLKMEVERRGFKWSNDADAGEEEEKEGGQDHARMGKDEGLDGEGVNGDGRGYRRAEGRSLPEDSLREQANGGRDDAEEDGVHL